VTGGNEKENKKREDGLHIGIIDTAYFQSKRGEKMERIVGWLVHLRGN
jgi:hypothetical protein